MPDASGILLLDKPVGPTSREVLDGVEKRLGIGPLGHAGTLDPLASGLLVVLAGRARRLQEFFLGRDKSYVARIRFGHDSLTLDAEGPIESTGIEPAPLDAAGARTILDRFQGDGFQVPPSFSALRVRGGRAHKLARNGQLVTLKPRPVRIGRLELLAVEESDWVLDIACGAGVYVRSLARDLGLARGCGAYLSALRRTRSGTLFVDDARPPEAASVARLLPLADVLAAEPRVDVGEEDAARLRNGDAIAHAPEGAAPPVFAWFRGRPCFKLLARAPGLFRSDMLLEEPEGPSNGGG